MKNMKKLICFLIIAVLFASCSAGEPDSGQPPDSLIPESYIYTAFTEAHENGGIIISYPQVEGSIFAESINLMIRDWAMVILEEYDYITPEELTLEADYEITLMNENMFSVTAAAYIFLQGAPSPNHVKYAININMETGEKIKLSDILPVNDDFLEILREHGRTLSFQEAEDYIKESSNEWLLNRLTFSCTQENHLYQYYYFTGDSMVFIFDVPRALGVYAEIEINNNYLQDFLLWTA